jgi:hypothetical protein
MSPKQKDPSISKLNDLGYNVIKVPRTDIAPLDLLAHDAASPQLRKIGTISSFWKTSAPVPVPGPPSVAASLNNTHSNKLELGFGLDLLKGALAVFGASAPSLDLSHTSARSLQFNYTGVTTVSIDTGLIGDYLTEGTLNVGNPETKHRFLDAGSQVYIITEVIRSTSITVTATDENGNGVSLSAPEINGILRHQLGRNFRERHHAAHRRQLRLQGDAPHMAAHTRCRPGSRHRNLGLRRR